MQSSVKNLQIKELFLKTEKNISIEFDAIKSSICKIPQNMTFHWIEKEMGKFLLTIFFSVDFHLISFTQTCHKSDFYLLLPSKKSNSNLNFLQFDPFLLSTIEYQTAQKWVNFHTFCLDDSMLKSSAASLHVSFMQVMLMIRVCVFLSLYWLHFTMMMDKGRKYERKKKDLGGMDFITNLLHSLSSKALYKRFSLSLLS